MSVRVRFAPSPTGYLHMGGARTALFNYLFARKQDGQFLLRIEDTDAERSKDEYTDAIVDAHEWLGLEHDEDIVYQSERLDLYREKAEELLEKGAAYKDWSTAEEIEEARQEGFESGDKIGHTRLWRDRDEPDDREDYVVRIKAPDEGSITINDHVQGEVTVGAEELDDFIIMRSDGTPTYNFVVVVDDAAMEISHVIRGKDHLNNTFRQYYVYEALGYDKPEFAHLPLIKGLSKRKGSKSVQAYREMGFLSEAVNNYLARLGWSHGDQELFSREEMIDLFSLEGINKSSGAFDLEKFSWVNSEWMKRLDEEDLAGRWAEWMREFTDFDVEVDERLVAITHAMKARAQTFAEMTDESDYFFADDIERNEEDVNQWLDPDLEPMFEELVERLRAHDEWTNEAVEEVMRGLCDDYDVGLGKIAQPSRVAVTGGTTSPGLFETLSLLGRSKGLPRLEETLEMLRDMED